MKHKQTVQTCRMKFHTNSANMFDMLPLSLSGQSCGAKVAR